MNTLLKSFLNCVRPNAGDPSDDAAEIVTAVIGQASQHVKSLAQTVVTGINDCNDRAIGACLSADQIPDIMTLFAPNGDVLYQNESSIRYFGNAISMDERPAGELSVTSHPMLGRLFALEPSLMEELVSGVTQEGAWTGTGRVPKSAHEEVVETEEAPAEETVTPPISPLGVHRERSITASFRMSDADRHFASAMQAAGSGQNLRTMSILGSMSCHHVASAQVAQEMDGNLMAEAFNISPVTPGCTSAAAHAANQQDAPIGLADSSTRILLSKWDDKPVDVEEKQGFKGKPKSECSPQDGSQGDPDHDMVLVHEITARMVPNPYGHGQALLVMQTDVTARTAMYSVLTALSEGQLSMLSSIFPRHVVDFFVTAGGSPQPRKMGQLARCHEQVTILFMDIVGFTSMSEAVPANKVMDFLNELFSMFDKLVDHHHVQKVETAGDCYIVAGGILQADGEGFFKVHDQPDPVDSARRVMAFAKDMLRCSKEVRLPHNGEQVTIRIGLHTGPCVSGLVGTKLPKFSIFGDTMNTASRMESTSLPGHIQVSAATHSLLGNTEVWKHTGGVQVKGKGKMDTMLWVPPGGFFDRPANPIVSPSNDDTVSPVATITAALSKLLVRSTPTPETRGGAAVAELAALVIGSSSGNGSSSASHARFSVSGRPSPLALGGPMRRTTSKNARTTEQTTESTQFATAATAVCAGLDCATQKSILDASSVVPLPFRPHVSTQGRQVQTYGLEARRSVDVFRRA